MIGIARIAETSINSESIDLRPKTAHCALCNVLSVNYNVGGLLHAFSTYLTGREAENSENPPCSSRQGVMQLGNVYASWIRLLSGQSAALMNRRIPKQKSFFKNDDICSHGFDIPR